MIDAQQPDVSRRCLWTRRLVEMKRARADNQLSFIT